MEVTMKFTIKDTLRIALMLSCVSITQIKSADAQALAAPGSTFLEARANQVDQANQIDDCFFKCTLCSRSILKDGESNEKFTATHCQHFFHEGCLERHKQAQRQRNESESCPSCEQNILIEPNPANVVQTPQELLEEARANAQQENQNEREARRQKSLKRLKITLAGSLVIGSILIATKATPNTCEAIGKTGSLVLTLSQSLNTPDGALLFLKTIIIQPLAASALVGGFLALQVNR